MADPLFSFTPFDFNGVQEIKDSEKQMDHIFVSEDFEEFNPFSYENDFYQTRDDLAKKPKSDYPEFDDLQFDDIFTTTRPVMDDKSTKVLNIQAADNKQIPLESLRILSNYGSKFKKMKGGILNVTRKVEDEAPKKSPTEEIMRVAGSRYIQYFSQASYDGFYMPMYPFGFGLSGLSGDETKDVDLAHILLVAAEKVGYEQFNHASKLLLHCEWIASAQSNPVQKIVFAFTKALRKRIEKEAGRMTTLNGHKDRLKDVVQGLSTNPTFITSYQKLPFNQVMRFTGIQLITEHVAMKTKVHLIDLEIRTGVQWTVLMQSFVEREEYPIELLKITTVGTTGNQNIEETGKRLASVAESLNLPFSFKAVFVSDMMDIKEELFEIESDEMVAIYCPLILRTMISNPNCLESLMRVIRNLNPSIMIVGEAEANHNSPNFMKRFVEALFFYSAFFDCVETCMENEDDSRMTIETILYEGIENIIATEGSERIIRNVKIEVWRAFFARFGMVELEFSESSVYQAHLMAKGFASESCCNLEKNEKCLIVSWKGTPILSISAWKFN